MVIRPRLTALLLVVTACAAPGGQPTAPPPADVVARFQPGGAQDVIEVALRGGAGASAVSLLAPGGAATPAYRLDVQPPRRSPREYGPLPSTPAARLGVPGAPSTTSVGHEIVTTAFVRVPDVIDYRRNWQAYRIRVEFGAAPGAPGAVTVRAPPPG
jgi:hypothetical protein